jgi:nucleoside-diphosphate-sugar epimerase
MRIVVIGGSGHVGSYLVPRLVAAGHEVVSVSRGQRSPYHRHTAWTHVEQHVIDRSASEARGTFGEQIRALRADAVIDMICFTVESAQQLVASLHGRVRHFLHCGTIWVHGPGVPKPTTEREPRAPSDAYGEQKAHIESFLLDAAQQHGFPATVLHPGHIVGPGWAPLNPAGHFNPDVFTRLASGEELVLPNDGLATVHHVHADDVAQAFERAINRADVAVGESFHVVAPAAISLRDYATAVAQWFNQPARLSYRPFREWRASVIDAEARATWEHIERSPNCSIEKAQSLLGYAPRYSSLEAVRESVAWLIDHGRVRGTLAAE